MRRTMAALAALGLTAWAGAAAAADWQYCFVLERQAKRFALSRAFATAEAPAAVQARFAGYLGEQGIDASGACPRAASRDLIQARMRETEAYNRREGNAVRTLDWPAEALVRR
jgi:hypothetical protein